MNDQDQLNAINKVFGKRKGDSPMMPFGKFKGEYLIDIDTSYLQWLIDEEVVYGPLKDNINIELSKKRRR